MTTPGWGDEGPRPNELAEASNSGHPEGSPAPTPDELDAARDGPPGGSIFSLEGRRAPGLYLVAWLLAGAGLLLTFLIGPMANSETARLLLLGLGVLLTTVGLGAGAGSQVLERSDRHPERYRGPSPLLAFGAYYFGVTFLGIIAVALGYDGTVSTSAFFVIGIAQAIGYVVVVWLFAVRTGALTWAQMGWPTWAGADRGQVLGNAVTAAVLMVPVTFGVLILGGVVATLLGTEAPDVVPTAETTLERLAVTLVAALLIPIGEEVFFRGLSLTAWRRDLGERPALIRSTVFFAVVHILNVSAVDFERGLAQALLTVVVIAPVGLVLGWMFLRRGLIGAISAHATYNLLLMLLVFIASDAA